MGTSMSWEEIVEASWRERGVGVSGWVEGYGCDFARREWAGGLVMETVWVGEMDSEKTVSVEVFVGEWDLLRGISVASLKKAMSLVLARGAAVLIRTSSLPSIRVGKSTRSRTSTGMVSGLISMLVTLETSLATLLDLTGVGLTVVISTVLLDISR